MRLRRLPGQPTVAFALRAVNCLLLLPLRLTVDAALMVAGAAEVLNICTMMV